MYRLTTFSSRFSCFLPLSNSHTQSTVVMLLDSLFNAFGMVMTFDADTGKKAWVQCANISWSWYVNRITLSISLQLKPIITTVENEVLYDHLMTSNLICKDGSEVRIFFFI